MVLRLTADVNGDGELNSDDTSGIRLDGNGDSSYDPADDYNLAPADILDFVVTMTNPTGNKYVLKMRDNDNTEIAKYELDFLNERVKVQSGSTSNGTNPFDQILSDANEDFVGETVLTFRVDRTDPVNQTVTGFINGVELDTATGVKPVITNDKFGFEIAFQNGFAGDVHKIEVVPEPASLALVGLGGLAMLSRRKRK